MIKRDIKHLLQKIPIRPRDICWTRGRSLEDDIHITCPKSKVKRIWDVGANCGDLSLKYARAFPKAEILAFEPLPSIFRTLESRTKNITRIECIPLALSHSIGTARFVDYGEQSTSSHLVRDRDFENVSSEESVIRVQTDTIDSFCESRRIDRIDLLKIDVEGHDLNVLRGGAKLLSNRAVGFIVVECGFDPENSRHIAFTDIQEFMLSFGYKVFAFYEQTNEFFKLEPQLRRADVMFISPQEVKSNSGYARRRPKNLSLEVRRLMNYLSFRK